MGPIRRPPAGYSTRKLTPGAGTTPIAAEDAQRAALVVINTGSATLYLDPSGTSTADTGSIPIPAGGYLAMVPPPIGPVTAYSAGATTCTVMEAR